MFSSGGGANLGPSNLVGAQAGVFVGVTFGKFGLEVKDERRELFYSAELTVTVATEHLVWFNWGDCLLVGIVPTPSARPPVSAVHFC